MNNILIIGGTGLVGSYLVRYFQEKGVCVDWTGRSSGTYHIDFSINKEYCYDEYFGTKRYDCVISTLNSYSDNLTEALQNNVIGISNVLSCFDGHTSQIIFISTIFAIPMNSFGSVYAFSKSMAENVVLYKMGRVKTKVTILQFAQIFDKGGKARNCQKGLYYFVDAIKNKKPISLFVKNEKPRSFMPIEILCEIVYYVWREGVDGTHVAVIKPQLYLSELVDVLREGRDYTCDIVKNQDKEALTYCIPPVSKKLRHFLEQFDSRVFLKRLTEE